MLKSVINAQNYRNVTNATINQSASRVKSTAPYTKYMTILTKLGGIGFDPGFQLVDVYTTSSHIYQYRHLAEKAMF